MSDTLACRRSYTVATMLVERRADTGVAWFIIDDLGRMNRNALESLRLGELVEATQVRLDTPRRTARASAHLSRPWSADRLGRAPRRLHGRAAYGPANSGGCSS